MSDLMEVFQEALQEARNDATRFGAYRQDDGDRPCGMFSEAPEPDEQTAIHDLESETSAESDH